MTRDSHPANVDQRDTTCPEHRIRCAEHVCVTGGSCVATFATMSNPDAWFAGASALAAVVTGVVAIWALVSAQKDSHDRSRPIVVARLRIGPRMSDGITYFVISNMGQSIARDVSVRFDPALSGDRTTDPYWIAKRYENPLPLVAPDETWVNIWYAYEEGGDYRPPPKTQVRVAYKDDRGRSYEDQFTIDNDTLAHHTEANPAGKDMEKRTVKALESAVWELWRR